MYSYVAFAHWLSVVWSVCVWGGGGECMQLAGFVPAMSTSCALLGRRFQAHPRCGLAPVLVPPAVCGCLSLSECHA